MSTRSVDIVIKAHDKASRKFNKVGGAARNMGSMIKTAAGMIGVYFGAQSIKSVIAAYSDFEKEMGNVSTMLNKQSMHFLPQYSKQLKEVSIAFGESTATLSKGLYDILSASIAPAKAMDVLTDSIKAAKAGMTDTAIAADAITTVLNSYGLKAEEAGTVSDKLFAIVRRGKITFEQLAPNIGKVASLASVAGLSFDEMGAAISTLTRAGLPAEIAITSVRSIINAFLKPAEESIKVAKKYGFEMNSATLKTMGLVGVIQKLKTASAEELAALIPNIRGMAGFASAVKQADGQLEDLNFMMNSQGLTQEQFNKISKTTAFKLARMNAVFTELKVSIGEGLLPMFDHLSQSLLGMGDESETFSTTMVKSMQKVTSTLYGLLDALSLVKRTLEALISSTMLAMGLRTGMGGVLFSMFGAKDTGNEIAATGAAMYKVGMDLRDNLFRPLPSTSYQSFYDKLLKGLSGNSPAGKPKTPNVLMPGSDPQLFVSTSEIAQKTIDSLKEQVTFYGMTVNAIAIYKAELDGATHAEIRNMQVLLRKLKALDDETKATKALADAQEKQAEERKKQAEAVKAFAQTVKDMLKTPADRFKEVQAQLSEAQNAGELTEKEVFAARNKYAAQIFGDINTPKNTPKSAPTIESRFLTMAPPELRTDPSLRIATSQLNIQKSQLTEQKNTNRILERQNGGSVTLPTANL